MSPGPTLELSVGDIAEHMEVIESCAQVQVHELQRIRLNAQLQTLFAALFTLLLVAFVAMLMVESAHGQARSSGADVVTARTLVLPVANPPQPVVAASANLAGNPGPQTYFYWIVADYAAGNSSPVGPILGANAPNTLSGTNYMQVSWTPPGGAPSTVTYDVLRTTTRAQPTGACNCAVATAVAGTSVNDQSNSLSSYTLNTLDPNSLTVSLTNNAGMLNANGSAIGGLPSGCSQSGGSGTLNCPNGLQVGTTVLGTVSLGDLAWGETDSGVADAYTINANITAYASGQQFCFLPAHNNATTTPTVNVNSLGTKTIVKNGGSAVAAGDLSASHFACVAYNGSTMDLLDPQTASGGGSGTVNSGTQYQLGYYATTGAAISGDANIITDANGDLGVRNSGGTLDAPLKVGTNVVSGFAGIGLTSAGVALGQNVNDTNFPSKQYPMGFIDGNSYSITNGGADNAITSSFFSAAVVSGAGISKNETFVDEAQVTGSSTIPVWQTVLSAPTISAGSHVNRRNAIEVDSFQGSGTVGTDVAFYANNGAGFGVVQDGTGPNYLAGNLSVHNAGTPVDPLDVNSGANLFSISTSGTPTWTSGKSTTGTRFVCVNTSGTFVSSASACSGT